jgi:hypothetical protein
MIYHRPLSPPSKPCSDLWLFCSLTTGEKEQLFLSGEYFEHRLKEVMGKNYVLTHDDFTHTRSWTRDCKEYDLVHKSLPNSKSNPYKIRDVGGDGL